MTIIIPLTIGISCLIAGYAIGRNVERHGRLIGRKPESTGDCVLHRD